MQEAMVTVRASDRARHPVFDVLYNWWVTPPARLTFRDVYLWQTRGEEVYTYHGRDVKAGERHFKKAKQEAMAWGRSYDRRVWRWYRRKARQKDKKRRKWFSKQEVSLYCEDQSDVML